nr:hypothetical protein [Tanacetum cinerariifolium]
MSSMGELTFFLGLQVKQKVDGIFISQDKYVTEVLRKFNFSDVKSASTPVDMEKTLVKNADDQTLSMQYVYVPDFKSHLRDSPFELVAYTDSDYAGASLDRKSTTGGCQFQGGRLISLQCKKQTVVATSTTKAKYVATASYCRQFWQTATPSTLDNGEMEITATIDGKVKVVTEASVRRHLKLEDSDGISNLPTTENFEQLALMGNIATALICLVTNIKFNFSKLIFDGMVKNLDCEGSTVSVESHHTPTDEAASTSVDVRHGGAATTITSLDAGHGSGNISKTPSMPYDLPLPRVHTLGSC